MSLLSIFCGIILMLVFIAACFLFGIFLGWCGEKLIKVLDS